MIFREQAIILKRPIQFRSCNDDQITSSG
jgi:hypothetical protein